MKLILIGNKKELLSSIVPESKFIDTVVLISKLDFNFVEQGSPELIIVDLDNISQKASKAYSILSKRPSAQAIWAYYSQNDCPVQKRLLEIGFNKVFSYEDNLAKAIRDFAQNT